MTTPDESLMRAQARAKFQAGEYRGALHLWDLLEHPELLTDEELEMRETALLLRDS